MGNPPDRLPVARIPGEPLDVISYPPTAAWTTYRPGPDGLGFTAADQLFVTLDPAARVVHPVRGPQFILTDTVGFIRKLPHELVAAFRATLEELAEADVLLHVVDASHPTLEDHVRAVEELLRELHVDDRPTVLVMNKIDRLDVDAALVAARRDGVAVSAATGAGIDDLVGAIQRALPPGSCVTLRIPHADGAALALCYERGRVLTRRDGAGHVELDVELPQRLLGTLARYRVAESASMLGMVD